MTPELSTDESIRARLFTYWLILVPAFAAFLIIPRPWISTALTIVIALAFKGREFLLQSKNRYKALRFFQFFIALLSGCFLLIIHTNAGGALSSTWIIGLAAIAIAWLPNRARLSRLSLTSVAYYAFTVFSTDGNLLEFVFDWKVFAQLTSFLAFTEIARSPSSQNHDDTSHSLAFSIFLGLTASFFVGSWLLSLCFIVIPLLGFLIESHLGYAKNAYEGIAGEVRHLNKENKRTGMRSTFLILSCLVLLLGSTFYLLQLKSPHWPETISRFSPQKLRYAAAESKNVAKNAELDTEQLRRFVDNTPSEKWLDNQSNRFEDWAEQLDEWRQEFQQKLEERKEKRSTEESYARSENKRDETNSKTNNIPKPGPVFTSSQDNSRQTRPSPKRAEGPTTQQDKTPQNAPGTVTNSAATPRPQPEEANGDLQSIGSETFELEAFNGTNNGVRPLFVVDFDSKRRLPEKLYLRVDVLDSLTRQSLLNQSSAKPTLPIPIINDYADFSQYQKNRDSRANATIIPLSEISRKLPIFPNLKRIQLSHNEQISFSPIDQTVRTDRPVGKNPYRIEGIGFDSSLQLDGVSKGPYRKSLLELPLPEQQLSYLNTLSQKITGNRRDLKVISDRIANYLKRQHSYSYNFEIQPGQEHTVIRWLKQESSGICSNFASAYLFLSRSRGIPTRIVLGYASQDFDPAKRRFTFTENNAHAWVEYLNRSNQWIRVDPTPAIEGQQPSQESLEERIHSSLATLSTAENSPNAEASSGDVGPTVPQKAKDTPSDLEQAIDKQQADSSEQATKPQLSSPQSKETEQAEINSERSNKTQPKVKSAEPLPNEVPPNASQENESSQETIRTEPTNDGIDNEIQKADTSIPSTEPSDPTSQSTTPPIVEETEQAETNPEATNKTQPKETAAESLPKSATPEASLENGSTQGKIEKVPTNTDINNKPQKPDTSSSSTEPSNPTSQNTTPPIVEQTEQAEINSETANKTQPKETTAEPLPNTVTPEASLENGSTQNKSETPAQTGGYETEKNRTPAIATELEPNLASISDEEKATEESVSFNTSNATDEDSFRSSVIAAILLIFGLILAYPLLSAIGRKQAFARQKSSVKLRRQAGRLLAQVDFLSAKGEGAGGIAIELASLKHSLAEQRYGPTPDSKQIHSLQQSVSSLRKQMQKKPSRKK